MKWTRLTISVSVRGWVAVVMVLALKPRWRQAVVEVLAGVARGLPVAGEPGRCQDVQWCKSARRCPSNTPLPAKWDRFASSSGPSW
jgi:hypothetical protein